MKVFSPASEIFLPGNPLVRSSEVKSGSGPEVIEAGRPGAANPTLRPDQPTNLKITKLQQHWQQEVMGTNTSQVAPDHERNFCLLRRNRREAGQQRKYGVALAIIQFMAIADI